MWKYVCGAVCLAVLDGAIAYAQVPLAPQETPVAPNQENAVGAITLSVDFLSGKLALSFSLPPALVQLWLGENMQGAVQGVHKIQAAPERHVLMGMQARTMFEIAERCLRNGDLDKARTCYEETHLLAPASPFGQKAMERLADIDNAQAFHTSADAEEQERHGPDRGSERK